METSFTYIIRSNQKENDADITSNCSIRLGGLPQQYRYFDASVAGFYVDVKAMNFLTTATLNVVELRAEGLNIVNGYDTQNNTLKTIAFASVQYSTPTVPYGQSVPMPNYKFKFENCNGKSINFTLLDDTGALLKSTTNSVAYDKSWILVLNLKGYN
jgi:hypothetical protein